MKKMRKMTAAFFAGVLSVSLFAGVSFAAETVPYQASVYAEEEPSANDLLLQGYMDRELSGQPGVKQTATVALQGEDAGNNLPDDCHRTLYHLLREQIEKIADVEDDTVSTIIKLSAEEAGLPDKFWTAEELEVSAIAEENEQGEYIITEEAYTAFLAASGVDLDAVVGAVLADCPFDLYWFDKTEGYSISCVTAGTYGGEWEIGFADTISFYFEVSPDYADNVEDYQLDTGKLAAVSQALNTISSVIEQNQALSDYNKLIAYREKIKELVSYNDEAADDDNMVAYGNPWQLIWVFDDDPNTTVVCEGYAKAFQYLCDLTQFESKRIKCRLVSGSMFGGTGEGLHMWNVVTMNDDENYLVDVTNCDGDEESGEMTVGYPDMLFLVGSPDTSMNVQTGYTFALSHDIRYIYDVKTLSLYQEAELALADRDYDPRYGICDHVLSFVKAVPATCTAEGHIAYWQCSLCGKLFQDDAAQVGIEPEDTVTDVLPHAYGEPEWHWAADYSSASAVFSCGTCDKSETVDAEVSSYVAVEPTTEETGKRIYTASVIFEDQTYTDPDSKEEIMPKKATEEEKKAAAAEVDAANQLTDGVEVADDPSVVSESQTFVSRAALEKYNAAVASAQAVLDDEYASSEAIAQALADLSLAKQEFEAAIQKGSKPDIKVITPVITLSKTSFVYNGKVQKPAVTVKDGSTILPAENYDVAFSAGCLNAGSYTVTVTLKGAYSGSGKATFAIAKAANPIAVKAVNKTVKYAKVKKKAFTVKGAVQFTASAQGPVTYKILSVKKTKFKKNFTIDKTGKIKVKKGTKKGKYTLKIQIAAAGNSNYAAANKEVSVKITVK